MRTLTASGFDASTEHTDDRPGRALAAPPAVDLWAPAAASLVRSASAGLARPAVAVAAPVASGKWPPALPQRHHLDLGHFPAIDLAALSEQGALLTRQDRKYLVDVSLLPHLVGELAARTEAAALELDGRRQLAYESVYYDTPSLTSYVQATRRRPRRFKVRCRTYVDSASSFLEVKTRDGRQRTVKERVELAGRAAPWGPELDQSQRAFVAGRLGRAVPAPEAVADVLTPTLRTHYRRATLYLPADDARVTVDVDLQALDRRETGLVLPGLAIVETKTMGRACAADRVLWRLGQRPMKVSKYATSLAALHPALPATKWLPALRRLGARAPAPGSVAELPTS